MAGGDSDIGGSRGRRIQLRAPRGSKKKAPRRTGFSKKRKEAFLAYFAATANADASARAAGISKSTVYEHRRKDAAFRTGWNEALAEGYARVEAHSVRWAEEALKVRAAARAGKTVVQMDPKVALAILESYRRNGGRRPGEILPQPYDIEAVRARLEAKMRTLGMIARPVDPSTTQSSSRSFPHPRGARGDGVRENREERKR